MINVKFEAQILKVNPYSFKDNAGKVVNGATVVLVESEDKEVMEVGLGQSLKKEQVEELVDQTVKCTFNLRMDRMLKNRFKLTLVEVG